MSTAAPLLRRRYSRRPLTLCLAIVVFAALLQLLIPEMFVVYSCLRFHGAVHLSEYTIRPPLSWWVMKGNDGDIVSFFRTPGKLRQTVFGDRRFGEMHFFVETVKGAAEEHFRVMQMLDERLKTPSRILASLDVAGQKTTCSERKNSGFTSIDCWPDQPGKGLVASYLGDPAMADEFLHTIKTIERMH